MKIKPEISKTGNFPDLHIKKVRLFFGIFYIVGFTGIIVPLSRNLFIGLIPFALILSFVAMLFFFEKPEWKKLTIILIITSISGFIIEVIGVHTHMIFGSYFYGNALGIKLLDTPLLIGINWALLVFITSSFTQRIKGNAYIKIVISASLMVLYDLIMENVAPRLDMWHWDKGEVPIQNFIAWFVIGFLFQTLIKVTKLNTVNKLAFILLICQISFFGLLLVYFQIINI